MGHIYIGWFKPTSKDCLIIILVFREKEKDANGLGLPIGLKDSIWPCLDWSTQPYVLGGVKADHA